MGKLRLCANRESSPQQAFEISNLRYRRLFETAQDGILILEGDTGKIIDANPFSLDLLGYPFESVIGLQLWEIGLFDDIDANKAAFAKLQTEEYIRYENHPLRAKDGKVVAVEFTSNVYFVGEEKVIQCNIRDISQRPATQTADKNRVEALEIAGSAKDDVIGRLSHELRTPLNAISTMIEVIEMGQGVVGQLPGQAILPSHAVALIRRNVETLTLLIGDLLDLTHLAKGSVHLNLETVDVNDLIGFVLKNIEGQQKAVGIEIDLNLEARQSRIQADAAKLEQILSNLIENALKFTPKGGRVSIQTRDDASGELVIKVSDSGIGIPAEALSRVFLPFEQGDPSIHPRYGGLGLGLSIAHTLTSAHGGVMEAESDGEGQGSKFTVRFKRKAPEPDVPEALPAIVAQKTVPRATSE